MKIIKPFALWTGLFRAEGEAGELEQGNLYLRSQLSSLVSKNIVHGILKQIHFLHISRFLS